MSSMTSKTLKILALELQVVTYSIKFETPQKVAKKPYLYQLLYVRAAHHHAQVNVYRDHDVI